MTADIMEKAEVLAAAIAQSVELQNLRSTEEVMMADEQAQQIITDFQNEQQRVYELQNQGQELTDEVQQAIDTMEARVEGHPLIAAYLQAQEQFTQMLDTINDTLAQAIANDPSGGDGGCAAGCSSCGGSC